MHVQALIVGLLVLGCTLYALWTLAPRAAQRGVARALLRQRRLAAWPALQRLAREPGGCGCDGCDRTAVPAPVAQSAVVRWQPRPPR